MGAVRPNSIGLLWRGNTGRVAVIILIAASAMTLAAVVNAAEPRGGARYFGKVDLGPVNAGFNLKVARSGRSLNLSGPRGGCNYNPNKAFWASAKNIRISPAGRFRGTRNYTVRIKAARGGNGELLDLVVDWTVKVSGRFVTARKARGRLTYEMRHHLEDQNGQNPPGPVGDEVSCGKKSGPWTARLTRR